MLKEFFFFPKGDRRAILVLVCLSVVGLCGLWWKGTRVVPTETAFIGVDSTIVALCDTMPRWNQRIGKSRVDTFKQKKNSYSTKIKVQRDTVTWVKKLPVGSVVDLNTADTALLKRVPGIGSWRARRIVQFRGHLGGYSRVEQLLEINGMPDTILHWFEVKTPPLKVLNLNQATVDEMAAHPYLTYKQARVILNHRRKHGALRSLSQLSLYPEFANDTLAWLEPYVAF